MRVGMLGYGAVGRAVVGLIQAKPSVGIELVGVTARRAVLDRARSLPPGCPSVAEPAQLLALHPDVVVEAASPAAVREHGEAILRGGTGLIILSVGALLDGALFARLEALAAANGVPLHVATGAIGGLDLLEAAALGGLEEVRLTTTKPPAAFASVAYLAERGIQPADIRCVTLLYEGSAAEAVRAFPVNVNVAAAICLAGIGVERTRVRVVADPAARHNCHELLLRGEFGTASLRLTNEPIAGQPRSSYLAALSVLAALRRLAIPHRLFA